MSFAIERVLRQRSITALAEAAGAGGVPRVQHVHSLGPARIEVPALPTGGYVFDLWPVRELPEQGMWAATHYNSFAPPVFVLNDVLVHSSAGILAVGDTVIAETLANTAPHLHAYRALARGIAISPQHIRAMPGKHISILAGADRDPRHVLLDGLARLGAVPDNYLTAADSLLVPASLARSELLELYDLLPSLAVQGVCQEETLLVETLILPLSVCGDAVPHPCVADVFHRLSASAPQAHRRLPRRIYIDRRGTGVRPLRNENDLIAALAPMGFEPVRPDEMSLADRIRLFRNAEAIVAPHDSTLVDLGFARPGCLVVELLMDAYVDWSFRNLAALMHLRYDCVLGRAQKPWADLNVGFHRTQWDVSVQHVVAAVAHSLGAQGVARAA
jgi:capsular polysaccharide biosynthesis protein